MGRVRLSTVSEMLGVIAYKDVGNPLEYHSTVELVVLSSAVSEIEETNGVETDELYSDE